MPALPEICGNRMGGSALMCCVLSMAAAAKTRARPIPVFQDKANRPLPFPFAVSEFIIILLMAAIIA